MCIFCGQNRRGTREHIYPDWVRQGIWGTGPTTITATKGERIRQNTTTGLTWILRDKICAECNGGWLSSLEKRVAPHLLPAMRGEPILLEPPMQRTVAAWSVKMALLFELKAETDLGQRAGAPASNLHWLYQHRDDPEPPPGCQVWVGSVNARLLTADAQTGWHNATTATGMHDGQLYLSTFAVGYLVFQVAGQDFTEPDRLSPDGGALLTLGRPDHLLDYLRALWPARSEVIRLPPPMRFRHAADLHTLSLAEGSHAGRLVRFDVPRVS